MLEINKIHKMDNLELMKQLDDNSIDLIYCDILYNTGKKFKDFDDRLGSPKQAVEYYRPRLIEMKRLLKNKGSIYLHMDYRLSHYIKILMDEIFGLDTFRNEIIWRYKRWTATSKNKFQSMHDTILFYGKNNLLNHQFEKIDKPKKQNKNDGKGKSMRDEKGDIIYHLQTERQVDDVWDIPFINPRSKERVGYDTQKPKVLLERIIKASTNEGDIVADFFCGSGTTMVVAKELGRKYIGCDINQRAVDITNERLNEINTYN